MKLLRVCSILALVPMLGAADCDTCEFSAHPETYGPCSTTLIGTGRQSCAPGQGGMPDFCIDASWLFSYPYNNACTGEHGVRPCLFRTVTEGVPDAEECPHV